MFHYLDSTCSDILTSKIGALDHLAFATLILKFKNKGKMFGSEIHRCYVSSVSIGSEVNRVVN